MRTLLTTPLTQFCGRRVQGKVKWAMAGRNEGKLKEVRAEIAAEVPQAVEASLLIADAADKPSLKEMAQQTDAVIAMVGPFEKFGRPVVEVRFRMLTCLKKGQEREGGHARDVMSAFVAAAAILLTPRLLDGNLAPYRLCHMQACIEEGAHYCDITGEITFVRHCIEEYDAKAKAAGVKIVHFCGFDSVPADTTALMTADFLQRRYGASVDRSEGVVMASKGMPPFAFQ